MVQIHLNPNNTDNCDGTVTDSATGLMWEQKTTAEGSGVNLADPHDVDNTYSWTLLDGSGGYPTNGTAFTDFLFRLNTVPCFAGHCDWRMPRSGGWGSSGDPAELESIRLTPYPCGTSPCIDPIFGPTAVADVYWSATTGPYGPDTVFLVSFVNGRVVFGYKYDRFYYVRAVRGGS